MADLLDYTEEYKKRVRPEINRRLKKVFLYLVGCVAFLYIASLILDYFKLPDKLIFILFFPCAFFYLYQIFAFKNIKCPNCSKSLFTLLSMGKVPIIFKGHVSLRCPHCGAKLR